jgi:hypothetical protein
VKRKSEEGIGQGQERAEERNANMRISMQLKKWRKERELGRGQLWIPQDIKMRKRKLVAFCCNCGAEREFRADVCTECSHRSSTCSQCVFGRRQNRELGMVPQVHHSHPLENQHEGKGAESESRCKAYVSRGARHRRQKLNELNSTSTTYVVAHASS